MKLLPILLPPAALSLLLFIRPVAPAQESGPHLETAAREAGTRRKNRRSAVVDLVERVKGAVVNIHSERTVQAPLPPNETVALQSRINGMGTGILIDPRGYIVTNHHVVEDVNLIRVRLADGTAVSARVLARDA